MSMDVYGNYYAHQIFNILSDAGGQIAKSMS